MTEMSKNLKPILIGKILKESFEFYKSNFGFLFLISLLISVFSFLNQLLAILKFSIGLVYFIVSIFDFVFIFWGSAALILGISKRLSNEEIDLKRSFLETGNKIWPLIIASIFYFLIAAAGCLFFLIPGIYFGIIFLFVGTVVVLENSDLFTSIKRSQQLIQGHFWSVFSLSFLLVCLFLPILGLYVLNITNELETIMIGFIFMLVMPYYNVVHVQLFLKLKQLKSEISPLKETGKKTGCLGCLSIVGLFIIVMILGIFWIKGIYGFLISPQGNKYYERLTDKLSPQVELSSGVHLEKPAGYYVTNISEEYPKSILLKLTKSGTRAVSISLIPLSILDIKDITAIQLESDEVWNKYVAYVSKKDPDWETVLSDKDREVQVLNINERKWVQNKMKVKNLNRAKQAWIYSFALYKDALILVTYNYKDESPKVAPEEIEMQKILSAIQFVE